MSAYYATLFRQDPVRFINTYTVDIKAWFEGLMRTPSDPAHQYLQAATATGFCRFDFDPANGLFGMGADTVTAKIVGIGGIDAYWVPYHAGTALPGHCDVLRSNPPVKYVFTAGMNGCAFVVTDSPRGPAYMRVYHHQHPGDATNQRAESRLVWQKIANQGQPILSISSFEDYGGTPAPEGFNPVAFNCLYYRNGTWVYLNQPQQFNALSKAAPKRQIGQTSIRSLF
jgi:hypothetical protein